ncbi:hypothetical protein AAG570_012455 [Ranatra chinensis]|uniref:Uncharacterized protein n=1 Tax=Ranatra chinensis TaxID=642074 RepID=A0ABD0YDW8_9HEMI
MASKRRNMFQKNKTQETTENGHFARLLERPGPQSKGEQQWPSTCITKSLPSQGMSFYQPGPNSSRQEPMEVNVATIQRQIEEDIQRALGRRSSPPSDTGDQLPTKAPRSWTPKGNTDSDDVNIEKTIRVLNAPVNSQGCPLTRPLLDCQLAVHSHYGCGRDSGHRARMAFETGGRFYASA